MRTTLWALSWFFFAGIWELSASTPSPKATLTLERMKQGKPPLSLPEGRLFALVIGIGEYGDKRYLPLPYAEADAAAFAKLLRTQGVSEIQLFLGNQAHLVAVRAALSKIRKKISSNDRFLFYFRGYGSVVGGEYVFSMQDTDSESLSATGLDSFFLKQQIDALPSKRQALFFDISPSAHSPKESLKKSFARPERMVFFSAAVGQRSLERPGQGLYTYHLLRALGGRADSRKDRCITAQEVQDYLKAKVSGEARLRGAQQNPQLFGKETKSFLLVRLEGCGSSSPTPQHSGVDSSLLRAAFKSPWERSQPPARSTAPSSALPPYRKAGLLFVPIETPSSSNPPRSTPAAHPQPPQSPPPLHPTPKQIRLYGKAQRPKLFLSHKGSWGYILLQAEKPDITEIEILDEARKPHQRFAFRPNTGYLLLSAPLHAFLRFRISYSHELQVEHVYQSLPWSKTPLSLLQKVKALSESCNLEAFWRKVEQPKQQYPSFEEIRCLEKIIKEPEHPSNFLAQIYMARYHCRKNRWKEGKILVDALYRDPKNKYQPYRAAHLGYALQECKDFRSIEVLKSALRLLSHFTDQDRRINQVRILRALSLGCEATVEVLRVWHQGQMDQGDEKKHKDKNQNPFQESVKQWMKWPANASQKEEIERYQNLAWKTNETLLQILEEKQDDLHHSYFKEAKYRNQRLRPSVKQDIEKLYVQGLEYEGRKEYAHAYVLYKSACESKANCKEVCKDKKEKSACEHEVRCEERRKDACFRAGTAKEQGWQGVAKDLPLAFALYHKACDLKHGNACNHAGLLVLKGAIGASNGGAPDLEEARRFFFQGCEINHANACYQVALSYQTASAKDCKEADRFLKKSCLLGYKDACSKKCK